MKKVLLIEDEEIIRKVVRLFLRSVGYEVSSAETFLKGLELAVSRDFDLILCDLKLPDKSGIEIIKILKEQKAAVPVVALSGFIDGHMIKKAKTAGAVAYITKPFKKETLLSILKNIIGV